MRNRLVSLGLAVGLLLLCCPPSEACGDKFLRMGRGLRNARATRPASILIYMKPDSVVPAAARELKLSASLQRAGHRIRAVEGANELEAALMSGTYDIVVGDPASATVIARMPTGKSKPSFLPVLLKPTRQELAAAEKRYRCFLAAPGRAYTSLAEIDHVMQERQKGARAGL